MISLLAKRAFIIKTKKEMGRFEFERSSWNEWIADERLERGKNTGSINRYELVVITPTCSLFSPFV